MRYDTCGRPFPDAHAGGLAVGYSDLVVVERLSAATCLAQR
jgi:hypothetical protein